MALTLYFFRACSFSVCFHPQMEVTLVDVFDESALSQAVKEEMYKCYPNARLAHLKTGGNFPFLSRADEVNMYIQVSVFLCLSL